MKRTIKYLNKELFITYDFNDIHLQTIFLIYANKGVAEFENRDFEHLEDIDGNAITWKICDDLVEMGLLIEDESAYTIYFEMTDEGKALVDQIREEL